MEYDFYGGCFSFFFFYFDCFYPLVWQRYTWNMDFISDFIAATQFWFRLNSLWNLIALQIPNIDKVNFLCNIRCSCTVSVAFCESRICNFGPICTKCPRSICMHNNLMWLFEIGRDFDLHLIPCVGYHAVARQLIAGLLVEAISLVGIFARSQPTTLNVAGFIEIIKW